MQGSMALFQLFTKGFKLLAMKILSPMMAFLLVSASIHAVLVITSNSSTNITLPSSKGSAMNVKIQEKHKTVTQQATTKPVSKKTIQQETLQRFTKKTPASKTQVKVANKQTIDKTSISSEVPKQAESKARIISIIHKKLNQHFTYPKLAQKRNWQGKVLLSLRVNSNGIINNVKVYSSSGYPILDQAAIDSLMKVQHLPKISSWLSYDINLKLPVIYQLTEG